MPSVGELLRRERVAQNRGLSDIAKDLRISSGYLEALETDNPNALPGEFFHRSFIRQYATALGFSQDEIKRMMDEAAPLSEPVSLEELVSHQQMLADEYPLRSGSRITTRVAVALFVAVLIGCSALFAVWNRAQEAADPVMQAEKALQRQSSSPAPASQNASPADSSAPTLTGQTATAAPAQNSVEDPDSDKRIDVNLAAKEKTWVKVSSNGRTVYSGILDASQTRQFALEENARLLTGNAAALDVHVNGRSIGPLGARGQVRLVLLTQNRFQILTPRDVTN